MEQVPGPTALSTLPETVHTVAGEAVKVTGSPKEDVAASVSVCSTVSGVGEIKLMTGLGTDTANDSVTLIAAA